MDIKNHAFSFKTWIPLNKPIIIAVYHTHTAKPEISILYDKKKNSMA